MLSLENRIPYTRSSCNLLHKGKLKTFIGTVRAAIKERLVATKIYKIQPESKYCFYFSLLYSTFERTNRSTMKVGANFIFITSLSLMFKYFYNIFVFFSSIFLQLLILVFVSALICHSIISISAAWGDEKFYEIPMVCPYPDDIDRSDTACNGHCILKYKYKSGLCDIKDRKCYCSTEE